MSPPSFQVLINSAMTLAAVGFVVGIWKMNAPTSILKERQEKHRQLKSKAESDHDEAAPVLDCIRKRRSIFPRDYSRKEDDVVSDKIINRLLEAAMWAPYHGSVAPWKFVVLGRKSMIEMQQLTINYYDKNWHQFNWKNQNDYNKWRKMTENEIYNRWGHVSYMIAIIMIRQAGSKRIEEWEEAAATSCAVQNMHIQSTVYNNIACYWSSWHSGQWCSEPEPDS